MPTSNDYGSDPYADPYSGGVPSGGTQYYPYATGGNYYNGGDYFSYMGATNNPDLNLALNLDPLEYNVYSGFDGQTPDGGYAPFNGNGSPNGPPPPPSYIGDSPAGFAANVIDPSMAMATATNAQTKNMLDDYDQAHSDDDG
jgi:hypothetical protein